jgi:hypothetical protein
LQYSLASVRDGLWQLLAYSEVPTALLFDLSDEEINPRAPAP